MIVFHWGSTITSGTTCDGHLNGPMKKKSIMDVTNQLLNRKISLKT